MRARRMGVQSARETAIANRAMRLHLGAIPQSRDFTGDPGWRPIREPNPVLMQVFAVPVGFAAAFVVGWCWYLIFTRLGPLPSRLTLPPSILLLSFPYIVVIHELIHASLHPEHGRSHSSILGFWPSRLLFYAHFDGTLSRNRFLAILVAPFLVISILPLLVAVVSPLDPTRGLLAIAWCSTLNALMACGDLLGLGVVGLQVPRAALVQNHGWRTYWRSADPAG